ncbi:MAG: porin [Phycisphaerales bacterium]
MNQVKTMHLLAGAAMGLAIAATASANSAALSADEIRAITAQTLADAETRSSLLQAGTAGYDANNGGFYIGSPDGAFRLGITGYTQVRYNLNFGDDDNNLGDDFESGFNMPNTVIIFHGQTHENIEFKIRGNFGVDGSFDLEDGFGQVNFDNNTYLRFGQFKAPFLREHLVDDSLQLAVARSITNSIFNQGRSQGVEFGYRGEDFGAALMFSDGFRTANTNFTDQSAAPVVGDGLGGFNPVTTGFGYAMTGNGTSDFAFTGRVEWKFAGTWDQFDAFSFAPGNDFAGMLGLAAHVELTADGAQGAAFDPAVPPVAAPVAVEGETTLWGWTADISLGGDGWNAFGAFYGLHARTDVDQVGGALSSEFDTDDYGFVIQGGIFIPNTDVELFARYDALMADDSERGFSEDFISQVTVGGNYYLHGHAAKFTLDLSYFFEDVNPALSSDFTNNYIGGTDDEVAIRAQFQFAF